MAAGTMTELVAARDDVDTSDMLVMFEAYQKVFVVNGATLRVIDFINDKIDLGAGNELTTPPLKGDTLTQATSGASMLVDFVDSTKRYIYGYRTTTATFNTTNTVSSDDAGDNTMDPATFTPDTVTARSSGPHWYTWTKHPSKSTSPPAKAYLGCLYRGRAVLSGNPNDPYQWYMARQGDPFDFDYAAGDAQSAVAGQNADAGKIGDVIRCLISYHDDYLIFGCANSIWYLDGDPAARGTMHPLSEAEGMFGSHSWCWDHVGNLWFWGTTGINMIPQGLGKPVNKTAITLPDLLNTEDADPSTHRILMGYDKKRMGIVITVTTLADGTNSNYWYDFRTEGIFPETYPEEASAYSLFYYNANDPDYADLLVGSYDGYIRKFDDSAKNDDAGASDEVIDSYVVMPIVELGNDADHVGVLTSLTFVNAGGAAAGSFSDGDDLEYSIYVADDPETLIEDIKDGATAHTTGSITATGRSNRVRSRVRGAYMALKIGNDNTGETFAVERVAGNVKTTGRIK